MPNLKRGLYRILFKEQETRPYRVLLRVNILFLEDLWKSILVFDGNSLEMLVQYEFYIKKIASSMSSFNANVFYIDGGNLYATFSVEALHPELKLKKIKEEIYSISEKDINKVSIDLLGAGLRKFTLFNKEIIFLKLHDYYEHTEKKSIEVTRDNKSLDFYPSGIEFQENRLFFTVKVKEDMPRDITILNEFIRELWEFNVAVFIEPFIRNGFLTLKGVFLEPFSIIKEKIHRVQILFNDFSNKEIFSGLVHVAPVRVVQGRIDLKGNSFLILSPEQSFDRQIGIEGSEIKLKAEHDFSRVPFIGRLSELEKFENLIRDAQKHNKSMVVDITGIPGIGKTRFARESAMFIKEGLDNIEVLHLELPVFREVDLYFVFSLMARKLNIEDRAFSRTFDELTEKIKNAVKNICEDKYLVIMIDNIHVLNKSAIAFLKKMFLLIGNCNLALVFISRESRKDVLSPLYRRFNINLGPLTMESIKYLVLEYLGDFPSKNMLNFIYERTQGIPLYILELLWRIKNTEKIEGGNKLMDISLKQSNLLTVEDIIKDFYENLKNRYVRIIFDIISVYGTGVPLHILRSVFKSLAPKGEFDDALLYAKETGFLEFTSYNLVSPLVIVLFIKPLPGSIIKEKLSANRCSRIRNAIIKALLQDTRIPDVIKYRVLARFYKEQSKIQKYVDALIKSASMHMRLDNFETAMSILVEAEDNIEFIKDRIGFYKMCAEISLELGNYRTGVKYIEKAMSASDRSTLKTLYPLAVALYIGAGMQDKGKEYFSKISFKDYGEEEKGFLHNAMGVFYLRVGDFQKSLEHLLNASKYLENGGGTLYLKTLSNLGSVYERMGKYSKAVTIMDRAISEALKRYDNMALMALYHNKGIINTHLGKYREALKSLSESIFWAEQMEHLRALAYIYNTKGIVYFEFGEYNKARENLERALDFVKKTEDQRQKASILLNMGFAKTRLGIWDEAASHIADSIEIREKLNDNRGLSQNMFYMGELLRQMERYEDAKSYFQKSLEIKEEYKDIMGMAYTYAYYGMLLIELSEYDNAVNLARKGLKIAEEEGDMHAISLLNAVILRAYIGLDDIEEVEEKLDFVKSLLSKGNFLHVEGYVHFAEGIYYRNLHRYNMALQSFIMAKNRFESTGEKKALFLVAEEVLNLLSMGNVYGDFADSVVQLARDAVNFYRQNGLLIREKRLTLILSRL